MSRIHRILISLFMGLCLVVGLSWLPQIGNFARAQVNQPIDASVLTNEGFAHFNAGDAATALKTWKRAAELYHQQGSQDGQLGNLVNQSLAMRSLGQFPQACQVLARDVLKLSDSLCFKQLYRSNTSAQEFTTVITQLQFTPISQLALYHLSEMLRLIGDFPNAKVALETLLKQTSKQPSIQEIYLSFGNLERASFLQLRAKLARSAAFDEFGTILIQLCNQVEKALQYYQLAARTDVTREIAQLNELSFLANLTKWLQTQQSHDLPELQKLAQTVTERRKVLLPIVLQSDFTELSEIDRIYARLNLVNSLLEFSEEKTAQSFANAIWSEATAALQASQYLQNQRAISFSLGALGRISAKSKNFSTAQTQLIEAMAIAQSISAWDVAYQWQKELALIAKQQDNIQSALKYYGAAIDSLDQVRGNLLSITPDLQFSFQDQVEPIYRDFMALLVSQPNPNLRRVIQTYERLKLAELENFLQCGKLELMPLSQKSPTSKSTLFYILDLDQTVGVIVQTENQMKYYTANAETVRNSVDGLIFNLQNAVQDTELKLPSESVLRSYSEPLYRQLIAPAEQAKLVDEKSSLVFIMDTAFQGIPLGLLHDGTDYLIAHYPMSLSIGSQLRATPHRDNKLTALVAALSQPSPSFQDPRVRSLKLPLSNVESEVQAIQAILPVTKLLNERFTLAKFQSDLSKSSHNIVHIATHGQFSSSPDETFLIGWDQLITAPQFSSLLKSRFQPNAGLDLLVLSACQTAQGDKRSPLGLAGIAAQSGAKTTLASLWLIDDTATAIFIRHFYENLKSGQTAEIALQQAQMKLRQTSAYSNPYFWSAFVLIGAA
ncbi:CHAT domain-containing protein [Leptolyngbya sp. GGD]|uniref:CHAT domain-containing protein n=1 Tax=Leptolyngbya sp. GGD TaxID=2997907 RepID=UPI00227C4149|nr:CHAT domain-containing protein [Leptolyngbya sp. GGD]MCY6493843.1 CHAT domain-containing protein [Leptolyngbya sp. GGD]